MTPAKRSDLDLPTLGLGTWAIGGAMGSGDQPLGYAGVDDREARHAIARALDLGARLFDTADAYGAGHSESLLGEGLAGRDDVLVATKFGNTIDEESRQLTGQDVSPAYVRGALAASLRRLRRDRIDLYQIHTPAMSADQAEDLTAELERLAEAGDIRWWGPSTDDPDVVRRFAPAPHCAAVQFGLNLFDDAPALRALCAAEGLDMLGRSPLAMGLLGGRYSAASRLPGDDVRGRQPEWLRWFRDGAPAPEFLDRLDAVRDALTADGRTLAQGAIGWVLALEPAVVPIPGFRNAAQVEEDLGATPLSAEAFAAVESALRPVVPHPA